MNTDELTLPFIAIRRDIVGDDYTRTMGEYVCNPLDEELLDVEVSTGGFFSDDDLGVISSIPNEKPVFSVPSGASIRFTISTRDEYSEMICHWSLRYRTATSGLRSASFRSSKGLTDALHLSDVPVLTGPGFVIRCTGRR